MGIICRCTFLLFALMSFTTAVAQDDHKLFSGSLIVGANFTQVDGDDYYGYHKIGLNAGAMAYAHFSNTWGMSMELIYSQKGSHGEAISEYPGMGTFVGKYFIKLNYAEVPVVLHYIFYKFDFEAGLSYARLIKSDEYVVAGQSVIIDPDANRFNTSDINYILGISRPVYKKFSANFRFQYSAFPIRPLDRIPAGFSWGTKGQFNNLITFRVLYNL